MELNFDDFALILKAARTDLSFELKDEMLYLTIKSDLIELLSNDATTIHYFGLAPDNSAEGNDELITNGVFYRIIAYEKNLGIDLNSSKKDIFKAYKNIIKNYIPFWCTIFIEEGKTKKEITIELMYQDVFV